MATKKITDLTELTSAASGDVLPIVDVDADITKKITTANMPISTATQTALDGKQDTLVSGTNIKTINSTSLLGSGDISIEANPSGGAGLIQFSDGSAFASDSNLYWDNTNKRLGIGENTPTARVQIKGIGNTSATTSLLVKNSSNSNILKITDDGKTTFGGNIAIGSNAIYDGANIDKSFKISGNTTIASNFQSVSLRVYDGSSYASGLEVIGGNAESRVGIGTTSPDSSAKLQINSTTKGFLPPQMTTTQKNAISSPASGLIVYDTTTNKLCCYNGTSWNDLF